MARLSTIMNNLKASGNDDLARNVMYTAMGSADRVSWVEALYAELVVAMSYPEARSILGLSGDPTPDEINKAYKNKAFEAHPDRGGDPKMMVQLNVARDILLKKQSPDYSSSPQRSYQSQPRPERKKIEVTFKEAAQAAQVPMSGVEWLFVTSKGYGGYGDKHRSGYVVYGRDSKDHIFVGVFNREENDPWDSVEIHEYKMRIKRVPLGQPLASVAPKVIRSMWSNFPGIKKYNAKVQLVDDAKKHKFDQNMVRLSGRTVSFKNAMDLLGEDTPSTRKKKVNVELELTGKPGGGYDEYIIVLVANGKPYELSPEASTYLTKKGLLKYIFGRYYYGGSKKNITRLRGGKAPKILNLLVQVTEKYHSPKPLVEALKAAASQAK